MAINRLACQEIILRALLKRGWFDEDTQRIKADAFILDRNKDQDGLSVNILSQTTVDQWLSSFNRSFGADSLHAGSIRDIDKRLDVGQSREDALTQPEHAVILGLPFPDDDPELAESLASRLAEISRMLDRTERRRRAART